MNNKVLGTNFENEMCELLANHGFWVHFITPDARGAQPFDIIAAKENVPYAVECKTLTFSRRYFTIDRLEDNQILAFQRWLRCGNRCPIIAVKQGNDIVSFRFIEIVMNNGKIDMNEKKKEEGVFFKKDEDSGYTVYGILKDMLNDDGVSNEER